MTCCRVRAPTPIDHAGGECLQGAGDQPGCGRGQPFPIDLQKLCRIQEVTAWRLYLESMMRCSRRPPRSSSTLPARHERGGSYMPLSDKESTSNGSVRPKRPPKEPSHEVGPALARGRGRRRRPVHHRSSVYVLSESQSRCSFASAPHRVISEPDLNSSIRSSIRWFLRRSPADAPAAHRTVILGDQKRIEWTLCALRISDPLRFYQAVRTLEQANADSRR